MAVDPKDFWIHKQKDATIVRLPGSVNGLDLMIEDLDDCTVYILDHSAQITVDYCNRTRFVIGPVDGPFFMRNCVGCTVTVACRQLRTRECTDTDIYLYCATKSPIIESSHNLRFHAFNVSYPHLRAHFASARLDPLVNHNDLVYDFSANDASIPQPHSTIVKDMPTLVRLRCFVDGVEIDGDSADTPFAHLAYPDTSELRVHKTSHPTDNAAAPSTTTTPATADDAAVTAASPVMESFGSNSVAAAAPAATAAATDAASPTPATVVASPPAFPAGVAPSIPSDLAQLTAVSLSPPAANSPDDAVDPAASDASASSSSAGGTAADAAAATATVSTPADALSVPAAAPTAAPAAAASPAIVVKEASFSLGTSAEDATKALYALAGVAYQEPNSAAAATAATTSALAAADAPVAAPDAESPSSPVDEDARLAAWFSSAGGMSSNARGSGGSVVSAEQAAQEARVAEAERRRVEALEKRRAEATAQAAASKAAAAVSLQEFYSQREAQLAEQRKAHSQSTSAKGPSSHLGPSSAATGTPAPTVSDAMLALLSADSAAASSSSSSSAPASASSLEAGWATVLSMLPAASVAKQSPAELNRVKLLYFQLKAVKEKQRAAEEAEARRVRREEKKRKKKEKKKKKRAKRKEKQKAAAAAALAAIIAAGGTAPVAADSDDSDSSSSDSSSSDDEE